MRTNFVVRGAGAWDGVYSWWVDGDKIAVSGWSLHHPTCVFPRQPDGSVLPLEGFFKAEVYTALNESLLAAVPNISL